MMCLMHTRVLFGGAVGRVAITLLLVVSTRLMESAAGAKSAMKTFAASVREIVNNASAVVRAVVSLAIAVVLALMLVCSVVSAVVRADVSAVNAAAVA